MVKRAILCMTLTAAIGCSEQHAQTCREAATAQRADIQQFKALRIRRAPDAGGLYTRIVQRQQMLETFCASMPMEDL